MCPELSAFFGRASFMFRLSVCPPGVDPFKRSQREIFYTTPPL